MIYADHAATTALSPAALEAMRPFWMENYGNPSSVHAAGMRAAQGLCAAREEMARLLCCQPREIYFTSGGSEADNQALLTMAAQGRRAGRAHLVSTEFEHPAVLRTLEFLQAQGFAVTLVRPAANGIVYPAQIEAALRPDTAGVSVMLVNNEIGTLQPIAEIAALCRARGVPLHTDAVQAVGQLPVSFAALGVDFLSLSAHKFRGPKGTGALVARRGISPFSLIRGGGQERGSRAGTENVAGIAGMAAALGEQCVALGQSVPYVKALREQLIAGLCAIPGAYLTGDRVRRVPGTVHFCFADVEAEALVLLLDAAGICASAGSACAAGAWEPSHVLRSLGIPDALARGALRLSLGSDNTAAQIDAILTATAHIVADLRKGTA